MEEGADTREYIREFFDVIDKLSDMDVDVNNDLLSVILLRSLLESYENFRCAMCSRDDLPPPETLRSKIPKNPTHAKTQIVTVSRAQWLPENSGTKTRQTPEAIKVIKALANKTRAIRTKAKTIIA